MTNKRNEHRHPDRSGNLECLMQVDKEKLKELVARLTEGWRTGPISLPQAGLGLLKLQDSAFHEPFYPGEFPVSSAHLFVSPPEGGEFEGAAMMMCDDVAFVEALAMCDAILTHGLPGYDEIMQQVSEGESIRRNEAKSRSAMLVKTRVDFSLLQDAGE